MLAYWGSSSSLKSNRSRNAAACGESSNAAVAAARFTAALAAAALPGWAGGVHQSQSAGPVSVSGPLPHSITYWSFARSSLPTLVAQSVHGIS